MSATLLYQERWWRRVLNFFFFFQFSSFPFFHNTPVVFNTTFTATPITYLIIEGNGRRLIKPVIDANICKWVYLLNKLKIISTYSFSFSLLIRMVTECFKTEENDTIASSKHCFDLLLQPLLQRLCCLFRIRYAPHMITFLLNLI